MSNISIPNADRELNIREVSRKKSSRSLTLKKNSEERMIL